MVDIRVAVRDRAELFAAPLVDPFAGKVETDSGFDRAADAARGMRRGAELRLVVQLPGDYPADGIEAAVHAMAAARAAETRRTLERVAHAGRQALLLGVIFLGVCMVLSAALRAEGLPFDFIRQVLSEGLAIAAWVGMWRPIELLLYDAHPLRRDRRVYDAMAAMPVTVERPA